MPSQTQLKSDVADFKVQHGLLDESDDRIALALYLMSVYDLDRAGALDQSGSELSNQSATAWAFDEASGALHILRGTLSDSAARVQEGFQGLVDSARWLSDVVAGQGSLDARKDHALLNLEEFIRTRKGDVQSIQFALITTLATKEVKNSRAYEYAERDLAKTPLYKWIRAQKGRVDLWVEPFTTERQGIPPVRLYPLQALSNDEIVRDGSPELRVRLVSLFSLVALLRRRGSLVFEKNVRMFLNAKENRARLEHPMQETFGAICDGSLPPDIFAIYHGGVTISAADLSVADGTVSLDTPSIVNGCQTVSIAERFLSQLEKAEKTDEIARFGEIGVIAKIVLRANDAQLREITNSNNRQNPIEAWQLFCNDPIHVETEIALRDIGVCYERQRGRFAALTKSRATMTYPHSNGTFIQVPELARLIAMCRRRLALAAKPSDVFTAKDVHDTVFDGSIPERTREIVWSFNCQKAATRGLSNFLRETQVHSQSESSIRVFSKPNVRAAIHHLCLLYLAQSRWELSRQYAARLNKKAPPTLIVEIEGFLRQVVSRMKAWYLDASDQFEKEVGLKRLDPFVIDLAEELRLRPNGQMPLAGRPMGDDAWPQF